MVGMMFENVREVQIKSVNGRINIEGWDNDYVEVDYTLHGEVDVEVEQEGDKLVIKEKPRTKKVLGIFQKSSDGWAEIELKVPRKVVVKAKNVNGELHAKNVRFTEAITVNGELELENCEAELIKTVNGEAKASLPTAGPLKATTVNGDIVLEIEELEDDIEVKSVNGDVVVRITDFCDARIKVTKVNGDVEIAGIDSNDPVIGAGTYEVKVSTVNGDVRVELI